MTGFTANEIALGRLLGKAIQLGTPAEAFGAVGTRTVGPLVHMCADSNGKTIYCVNGERGVELGRTYATARAEIIRIHQSHKAQEVAQ